MFCLFLQWASGVNQIPIKESLNLTLFSLSINLFSVAGGGMGYHTCQNVEEQAK